MKSLYTRASSILRFAALILLVFINFSHSSSDSITVPDEKWSDLDANLYWSDNSGVSDDVEKRAHVFRYGKRSPSVFRYGRRSPSVFRYGKRTPLLQYMRQNVDYDPENDSNQLSANRIYPDEKEAIKSFQNKQYKGMNTVDQKRLFRYGKRFSNEMGVGLFEQRK
jgi:hypothetical protein